MNRFLKYNSPWLGLLGLAILIILLAFFFGPKSPQYQISADQAIKILHEPALPVSVQNLAGKQIIDIRSAELFAQGHAANAINIPIRQLLDEESTNLLQQLLKEQKPAVLVGSDELQAVSPWLLLQQMGYTNILRLKGGYLTEGGLTETALSATETSVMDTAAFRNKPTEIKVAVQVVQKKKPETVLPVRKEASSGGGC